MRIAVLTNAYPPEMKGGAGRMAELQVAMLEAAGHEVRVWHPEIPWLKWFAPLRLLAHLADLLPQTYIAQEILDWQPNILLTHNLTGCGFGTPSFIQRKGVRWIHVLHDVQLFEPSGRLRDAKAVTRWQKLWSGLRRNAFSQPNLVLSPTVWLLDEHKRRGFFQNIRTEVLPNPAPPVSFALRSPTETPKLLFVGGTKEKGKVMITHLASRISHPLKMIYGVPQETIMEEMREADILLFPSQIVENQPTALLEAASVGLPVIASDVGGVRETLAGAGILLPKDDETAWIEAIEFLADPAHYRDQSTKMYELAKRHEPEEYFRHFEQLVTGAQI